ncbi:MAG: 16S rRNA (adenine(1518)-N(6)/adenine(1519)-N(6))-dimethyltransferase RsmA [Planctomycetota bacterium]|nr:16S rRNA (adenine(1518)-N(6)/adenine(1519)-N(6))-dimethyltransferase RsmA [Planctomycetota bacterium]
MKSVQTVSAIRELLESRGLAPSRALGQNFLIEPAHVARLVDAAALEPGALVLEVGPGTGVLTDVLLERGCRVVACELDRGLAALLRERLGTPIAEGRLTIVEGDCLDSKDTLNPDMLAPLSGRPFKLVANLPYNAASPLMIALATRFHPALAARAGLAPCLGQFVTIQREVGERLRARPGTRDYGEMGVLVQAMADVRRLAVLPPGCFWPPPKVDSEMVAIEPRSAPRTQNVESLARLCRLLFTQRRKQLGTILARVVPDAAAALPPGIERQMRPEQLTVEQLDAVARLLEP